MKKPIKTWTATKYRSIYRHASGVFYARLTVNRKKTWRSLRTTKLGVARSLHADLVKEQEANNELHPNGRGNDDLTMAGAATLWMERIENDPGRKSQTKKFWRDLHTAMLKHSPALFGKNCRKVSRTDCERWAKDYSKCVSPSRYNNALGALKNILEVSIEHGARLTNPAKNLKRVKMVEKDLTTKLPELATFRKWVEEIRQSPTKWAKPCADLVEFLAYSGVRLDEAKHVLWKHVNIERSEILVTGNPKEGTKNRKIRRVPIIGEMEALLGRLAERPISNGDNDRILTTFTARAAMKRAALKIGMEPITHHDLRHLFATICIESGVDIPTVAKWLGHLDKGVLAMKVYGHLRDEHSREAAKKVSFGSRA